MFVLHFFCKDLLRGFYYDRHATVYCIMVCMHHSQLVLLLSVFCLLSSYRQHVRGVCHRAIGRVLYRADLVYLIISGFTNKYRHLTDQGDT